MADETILYLAAAVAVFALIAYAVFAGADFGGGVWDLFATGPRKEQQRTAICRALANSPKLLLADEPTGNLDPSTSELVFRELIKLIEHTGVSALIATHNMDLARGMHRILRLEDGILREIRPADVVG